jgi:hypothetical protein
MFPLVGIGYLLFSVKKTKKKGRNKMKTNYYENMEIINMISENSLEVALEAASRKITQLEIALESEKKSTFNKVDKALFKGFMLGGAMATFLIMAFIYAIG